NSSAVRAEALNNMTDIIVSLAVIIGLKISIKPADRNHPYGHFTFENISSLLVSFVIMFGGIQGVIQNAPRLFQEDDVVPNAITIIVSLISGRVMLIVFAV
ncbi:cation diffusion facilitator family transporter, partial [Staphylococcus aureus]